MFAFIFHSDNILFSSALILMLFIAVLEGLLFVIGAGLSDILDSLIPDFDTDLDMDLESSSYSLTKFFAWIRLKKVPVLMLLVIFLTSFSISGLFMQLILLKSLGVLFFQYLIAIPALIISLFSLRFFGGIISKLLPKDESSSISKNDLIGHIATITLGNAKKGFPAEAKTRDKHGQTHYFMIEPQREEEIFNQGQKVLILGENKNIFYATKELPDKLR